MSDPEPLSDEYFAFMVRLWDGIDEDAQAPHDANPYREVAAAALRWAVGRVDWPSPDANDLRDELSAKADEIEAARD